MTEKLFYADAYIFSFDAVAVSCEQNKKKYNITLDRSAFYPEGGGQPGDSGKLVFGDQTVFVSDTQEKDGDIFVIADKPVAAGTAVHCEINRGDRMNNMVKHSGEHIFAGFASQLFGCRNVGFHMQKDGVGIDFDVQLTKEQLDEIEDRTNDKIRENVAVRTFFPTEDELENTEFRSKKEIEGDIRLVEIPGCDMCACCGTHVRTTGEVGIVKCVQFENYKGGTRLLLKIGKDAVEDYRARNDELLTVAAMFSAKPDTVASCAEKFLSKSEEMRVEIASLKEKLFSVMAEDLKPGRITADITDAIPPADIMTYADIIMKKYGAGLVFAGNDENGYKFALCAGDETDAVFALMKEKLGARGGGRNGSCQGQTAATREQITAFIAG